MDDPLLSKLNWNGDKWLGGRGKRNRTVLEKHFDGGSGGGWCAALNFLIGIIEGVLEAIYWHAIQAWKQ